MAHICTCTICGKKFDRDKISYIQVSARRYCHAACDPNNPNIITVVGKDPDLVQLQNYIIQMTEAEYVYPNIRKQLNKYVDEMHFTYRGILNALIWWNDIMRKKTNKDTIGIVPYIYENANQYFLKVLAAQKANDMKQIVQHTSIIRIKPPKSNVMPHRLFFMEDDE